jgi:hypothetical protein
MVLAAFSAYDKDYPLQPFHQSPFEKGTPRFTWLKQYLPDLNNRSAKQLRERCVNVLFNKAIPLIAEEHKPILLTLHEQYGNKWEEISKYTYDNFFNKDAYYPGNAIKNLVNSVKRRKAVTDDRLENVAHRAKKPKQAKTLIDNPNDPILTARDYDYVLALISDDP